MMHVSLTTLQDAFRGRYRLEGELGVGGMATVYAAWDEAEDRPVALKVLLPELTASVGGERFLREVSIGAKLSHPHIVPLYGSGQADGFLYYAMPRLEGETLRARLDREGQLPVEEALAIARQVAGALTYAHEHGVVHRDIKPENIMLSEGGAVVMDFGIARALDTAGGEKLTETGLAVGTPAYMSPEQAAGTKRLDGRSDQYSLACVLYEMLAGHAPFTGKSSQVLLSRAAQDPVPPLSSARPTVSGPLEAVIHKALEKVPADRFASAEKLTEALDMAEQGVTPRGVTPSGVTPWAVPYRPTIWTELARRRVYQVAASYGVIAWALVQVAEATFEPLGIPMVARTWLVWGALGGFPLALLLAWLYELTPRGVRRTQAVGVTPQPGARVAGRPRLALTLGVLAIGIAGAAAYMVGHASGAVEGGAETTAVDGPAWFTDLSALDPLDFAINQVAVMPFRADGVDPELRSLGAGLVDLLDVAFHGDAQRDWTAGTLAGLRSEIAPDPAADLTVDEARQVAALVGAGRVVQGALTGTTEGLTISATIRRTSSGTVLGQETVTGPASEIDELVTRLAIQLFAYELMDEVARRDVAEAAPEARAAFLEGLRGFWSHPDRGGPGLREARRALSHDSTFALAAWLAWLRRDPRGIERLWPLKDELNAGARAHFLAHVGPEWPAPRTVAEAIDDLELAVDVHPEFTLLYDALTWQYYWEAAFAGLGSSREIQARIGRMQRREREVKEGEENPGSQFVIVARGYAADTAGLGLGRLARAYLEMDLTSGLETPEARKWLVGTMLPDRALVEEARAEGVWESEPLFFRFYGVLEGKPEPDALYDYERSIEALEDRAVTRRDQERAVHYRMRLAEFGGRPAAGIALLDDLSRVEPPPPGLDRSSVAARFPWRADAYPVVPIVHAVVRESGWQEALPWAIEELDAREPEGGGEFFACSAALGTLLLGDVAGAEARLPRVLELARAQEAPICAALLEALIAHERSGPGLPPSIRGLDDLMRTAPGGTFRGEANLVLAQLLSDRGYAELALDAVRRRGYGMGFASTLASYARLEGRLSALAGDTISAVHAYRHFLALRQNPEAVLQPQVDSVRAELDAILEANPAHRAHLETRNVSLAGDSG